MIIFTLANFEQLLIVNHRKNRISCKSVVHFTTFFHKESSIIDNRPSKELLKNEFLSILHFNIDFDNSIL